MALNRSDKSRILRRYFPGMTHNSEMSTEPKTTGTETEATGSGRPTRKSCGPGGSEDAQNPSKLGSVKPVIKYGIITSLTGVHVTADLNQSQGGMCIYRVLGIGAGVSQECFGP